MRIAVAQFDPTVGDFAGNLHALQSHYEWACSTQAHLLLSPELSLVGYLPLDLLDRPEIFSRSAAALERVRTWTLGRETAIAVGWVRENPTARGRAAENAISVVRDGKVEFTQIKTLLPTYDVFDEARYFEPARAQEIWIAPTGERIVFAICEDLWGEDPNQKRMIYGVNPVERYAELNGDLLISMSASPYEFAKRSHREGLHGTIARKLGLPLLYLNQVGGTDEILYDGGTFALAADGSVRARLPVFREARATFDFSAGTLTHERTEILPGALAPPPVTPGGSSNEDPLDTLLDGLTVGIRDYFRKTGFTRAILGLSGGIDSALVAALAARALGPANVLGIAMPSIYSSGHSLADAESLAQNLGIRFEVQPIKFLFSNALRELSRNGKPPAGIAEENLQSRLRGLILMTRSNEENALVLSTGNKSELAVGYCTLYGDMCGALAPIGDLLKTRVYALSRRLNERFGECIPDSTLTKAPSAELKPDQVDQDSLPPYAELDAFLERYLERAEPVADLRRSFAFTDDILRKLEFSEYKRRQAAPALKDVAESVRRRSPRSRSPKFGIDNRRYRAAESVDAVRPILYCSVTYILHHPDRNAMNSDIKKIIDRVKKAQTKVQKIVKDKTWVSKAKKYAERQGKDVKKVIDSDVSKIRAFLNRERKELEKLKSSIPGEVEKIRSFVDSQKSDLQTLLNTVKKDAEAKAKQATQAAKSGLATVRGATSKKTTAKATAKKSAKKTTAKKTAKKSAAKTTAKKTAKKSAAL